MKPRRWFSFSLRTLLVLLTLFGCAFGWLGVQVKWLKDRHKALRHMDGVGYIVTDSSTYNAPPWQLRLFGERSVGGIRLRGHAGSRKLQELKQLFPEADISLY